MTESFYDVLGVAEDATTEEIETAYRERLKETHPDVSDDDDAGQATKTLIEARDVLVDEDERARYDRVSHAAYVGDGTSAASEAAASERDGESADRTSDSGTSGGASQSRSRREQRASERVRQERRRAREARQKRRQQAQQNSAESDATASAETSDVGTDGATSTRNRRGAGASTASQRAAATDGTTATASGNTYSVREDVTTSTSHGPLLPQGEQLTLLAIFFALYPVLLFSALLPAFPPFVNVVLGACTLMTIIYLQSMPRVSLLVFGGWSGLSVVGLGVFGVGYLSAVGLVVLAATVLPFGFSVLTAAALRY